MGRVDAVGRLTRLPRITILALFGVLVGPHFLDLLMIDPVDWRDPVAALALTMIAFLLGGELSMSSLRRHGRAIFMVSLCVTAFSFVIVALGLIAFGAPLPLALLLAGISLATDPAAIQDVIRETRANGPVTKTVIGVVAIDDAWGVIVFSLVLGLAASLGEAAGGGGGGALVAAMSHGAGEVLGTKQSGLPEFRLADIALHGELMRIAHDDAKLILERDPALESDRGKALRLLLYLFERDAAIANLKSG